MSRPPPSPACLVPVGDVGKDVEQLLVGKAGSEPTSKSAKARELILDVLDADGPQESDAFDARIAAEAGVTASRRCATSGERA